MDLRRETIIILEAAGYQVRDALDNLSMIYFEDSSLIGFVTIERSYEELISDWKVKQNRFLETNAQKLRSASLKAWNAYSVLLTQDSCSVDETNTLRLIEEDFRGTRKIAVAGLITTSDLRRALYPLLPLQNLILLQPEDTTALLRSRLDLSESQKEIFLGLDSAEELVKYLMDEE